MENTSDVTPTFWIVGTALCSSDCVGETRRVSVVDSIATVEVVVVSDSVGVVDEGSLVVIVVS